MGEQLDNIMTVPEVACYLKICKSKVYSLVQRQKMPHVRIGRNVRVRQSNLRAWIEKNVVFQPGLKFGGRE
jgi:excisionase family DNA binding protein